MIYTLKRILLLSAIILQTANGCTENPSSSGYREELVVEGYLIAKFPLPPIRISRTVPIEEEYSAGIAAVHGASVEVSAEDGTFRYREADESDGYLTGTYLPEESDYIVRSGAVYTLRVEKGRHKLEAWTKVPDPISVRQESPASDILAYREERLRISWTESSSAASYIIYIISVDPDAVPIRGDEDSHVVASSLTPDLEHEFFWAEFSYYGTQVVKVMAMDQNFYDYIRSKDQDEFALEDPIFHMEGGLGVFGSAAVDSLTVVLIPKEQD